MMSPPSRHFPLHTTHIAQCYVILYDPTSPVVHKMQIPVSTVLTISILICVGVRARYQGLQYAQEKSEIDMARDVEEEALTDLTSARLMMEDALLLVDAARRWQQIRGHIDSHMLGLLNTQVTEANHDLQHALAAYATMRFSVGQLEALHIELGRLVEALVDARSAASEESFSQVR